MRLAKRQVWSLMAIIPTVLGEMLQDDDAEKAGRVMGAMLQMTKIEIKTLKQAYDQQ